MDQDFRMMRSQVPAFGSWDWNKDLPFTQCFESARQAGLLRYTTYSDEHDEDRDLYVAGDLYENHVVTPTMIVVPRRRNKMRQSHVKEAKEQSWVVSDVKEPPSPPPRHRPTPKPVDEDFFAKSHHTSLQNPKRREDLGSFEAACCQPVLLEAVKRRFWTR